MIVAALVLMIAAVALLRAGWGGRREIAVAGWVLGAGTLLALTWRDGAWGLAIGLVVAMAAALMILLYAAAVSPLRVPRRATRDEAIAELSPEGALGRRFAVFALVVPVSFLAAQWFAYGLNLAMRGEAGLDTNSLAVMLFAQPVVWAILMAWQMTMSARLSMLAPPAIAAGLGTMLWMMS